MQMFSSPTRQNHDGGFHVAILRTNRSYVTSRQHHHHQIEWDAIPNQNKQLIDVTPVTGKIDQSPGMDDALCNINALIDNSEDK